MLIDFQTRPPSAQWEPLPLVRIPQVVLWVWYRPQSLPNGLTIQIPAEVSAAHPQGLPFTLADLLQSAGISLQFWQAVSIYGAAWQNAQAMHPYLQHAVPQPTAGGANEIQVLAMSASMPMNHMQPALQNPAMVQPTTEAFIDNDADDGAALSNSQIYDRMKASWNASIQMERQMTGLRQKLSGLLNNLNKLDRELSPQERLASDREDRDAWEDVRRWVRDLSGKCHREIKQFDIGMTSAAGRKNQMEQIYTQYVEKRVPCPGLETHRREFETYRKDMMTLQRAMTTAIQGASQNGTQRAQRVLNVINRKVRERRQKK